MEFQYQRFKIKLGAEENANKVVDRKTYKNEGSLVKSNLGSIMHPYYRWSCKRCGTFDLLRAERAVGSGYSRIDIAMNNDGPLSAF